jgi:hypothetical protein
MEAVRKVLVADTASTGYSVPSIASSVSTRIFQGHTPNPTVTYPMITMTVDEGPSDLLIDTSQCYLNLRIWVQESADKAPNVLDAISTRIEYLINKKPEVLNQIVSSKKLRCRLIYRQSSVRSSDPVLEVITKHMIFFVILDDETVNT